MAPPEAADKNSAQRRIRSVTGEIRSSVTFCGVPGRLDFVGEEKIPLLKTK